MPVCWLSHESSFKTPSTLSFGAEPKAAGPPRASAETDVSRYGAMLYVSSQDGRQRLSRFVGWLGPVILSLSDNWVEKTDPRWVRSLELQAAE